MTERTNGNASRLSGAEQGAKLYAAIIATMAAASWKHAALKQSSLPADPTEEWWQDVVIDEMRHICAALGAAGYQIVRAAGKAPANRDEPTQDTTEIVPNQSYAALVAERDELRKALAGTVKLLDEIHEYQKRPDRGAWGVECALCMGELIESAEITIIEAARAALSPEHQREEGK